MDTIELVCTNEYIRNNTIVATKDTKYIGYFDYPGISTLLTVNGFAFHIQNKDANSYLYDYFIPLIDMRNNRINEILND